MELNRFFYFRKFSRAFSNRIHKKIYEIILRKADLEIPAMESLIKPDSSKKTLTVYISGRKSRIEQFILAGFMSENGITPPSHSFGPRTVFFRPHKELWIIALSFLRHKLIPEEKIESLYIPVDSPEELVDDIRFLTIFRKIKNREIRIVPVITLWNKNLHEKSRWDWMRPLTGDYNLWSTSWELLMLIIKRRKLTLRIESPKIWNAGSSPKLFINKLYKTMEESQSNVVGASLKSWLSLKNDTLVGLNLEYHYEREEALKIINKMATNYSPVMAELYTSITELIFKTIFTKFHYSKTEIAHLRSLCALPKTNIIFVPTHKSYFDYLILNYLLYSERVTVPLVASGDDFSFFPLGRMLKKMGVFFIRRTMKDDPFYQDVLKNYLKNIVETGYNMEFFIEGGRSRSGMVRSPRTGMLKMLAEIGRNSNRRLYVIPVSLTYEKLKEIDEYKKEKKGSKAPEKENFWQKFANLLKVRYGPVYIRFSRPIYLSSKFTNETAFRIAEVQEKSTVISFSSLFSSMFICFRDISSNELVERMEFCTKELKKLPFIQTADALENLDVNCSKLLNKLIKKGDIKVAPSKSNRYFVSPGAVSEFMYYKNSSAFAVACFFVELFDKFEKKDFVEELLETTIMGYTRTSKGGLRLLDEDYPEWFKAYLINFFINLFGLIRTTIEKITGILNTEKISSHGELVARLLPVVGKEYPEVTADEIYEVIFFLEKKHVLTNNLNDFNKERAEHFSNDTAKVEEFLRGGNVDNFSADPGSTKDKPAAAN